VIEVKILGLRGRLSAVARLRIPPTTLLVALTACGSDPVKSSETTEPEPVVCEEGPGYLDETITAQHVGPVRAVIFDTESSPVDEGLLVQVCGVNVGSNICVNGEVTAAGRVEVATDNDIPKPAFKYGDGLAYGKLALLLPDPSDDVDFETLYLPRLPALGAALGAGQTSESGGVRIVVQPGTAIHVDPLFYRTPEEQAFRAAELSPELFPPGLDRGTGLELVFTLAPLDMTFCPGAELQLPNTPGWAPGTEVELLLQGLDIDRQPWAPYGEWAVFATGEVEAEGERIVTTEGTLPILSNVGVRRK
jgi:hypothetical protein